MIQRDGDILTLRGNDETQVESGDAFVLKTPGGGGFWPSPKDSAAENEGKIRS